jgi:ribosomal protein S18 acetylase RimI-like enzyme
MGKEYDTVLFTSVNGKKLSLIRKDAGSRRKFFFVKGDASRTSMVSIERNQISNLEVILSQKKEAKIIFVYTHPSYRKLRLTKSLLIYVLHYLKGNEFNIVHLTVGSPYSDDDTDAVLLYRALGFSPTQGKDMILTDLQKKELPKMDIREQRLYLD